MKISKKNVITTIFIASALLFTIGMLIIFGVFEDPFTEKTTKKVTIIDEQRKANEIIFDNQVENSGQNFRTEKTEDGKDRPIPADGYITYLNEEGEYTDINTMVTDSESDFQ